MTANKCTSKAQRWTVTLTHPGLREKHPVALEPHQSQPPPRNKGVTISAQATEEGFLEGAIH